MPEEQGGLDLAEQVEGGDAGHQSGTVGALHRGWGKGVQVPYEDMPGYITGNWLKK